MYNAKKRLETSDANVSGRFVERTAFSAMGWAGMRPEQNAIITGASSEIGGANATAIAFDS
jgi:hypothetical protein